MKKAIAFILTALLIFMLYIPASAAVEGTPISTYDGLKAMSGSAGKFYLAKDITVPKSAAAISPIENFNGKLNGNGKKISGLKIKASDSNTNIGLFDAVKSSGRVENLTLENVTVEAVSGKGSSHFYVGAIAGTNYGTIENCRISGKITVNIPDSTVYAGGVVGYSVKSLKNLENYAELTVTSGAVYAGGIAGDYSHTGGKKLEQCINHGNLKVIGLKSTSYGGGIVGRSDNEILNCANYGSVYVESDDNIYAGGIVGAISNNPVTKCYNAGEIHQKSATESFWDAICGSSKSSLKGINCYALSGCVKGKNDSEIVSAEVLSADEAKSHASFGRLDFSTWKMTDGKLSLQDITAAMPKLGSSSNTSSTTSSPEYIPPINGSETTSSSSTVSDTVSNPSSSGSSGSIEPDDLDDFTLQKAPPIWIFIVIAVIAISGVGVFLYKYKKKN